MPSYLTVELNTLDIDVALDTDDIVAHLRRLDPNIELRIHDAIVTAVHDELDRLLNRGLRIDDAEYATINVGVHAPPPPPPLVVQSIHTEPF